MEIMKPSGSEVMMHVKDVAGRVWRYWLFEKDDELWT